MIYKLIYDNSSVITYTNKEEAIREFANKLVVPGDKIGRHVSLAWIELDVEWKFLAYFDVKNWKAIVMKPTGFGEDTVFRYKTELQLQEILNDLLKDVY